MTTDPAVSVESAVLTSLMLNRPASRKQIATQSILSAATVSRAAKRLIEQGIVRETAEVIAAQPGRREVLLDVVANRHMAAGIDLGASNTRIVIGDLIGHVIARRELPTPTHLPGPDLASWLASATAQAADDNWTNVSHVYVGVPGAVTADGTAISNAPNLPAIQEPTFIRALEKSLDRHLTIDNDTNAALLGELHFGSARGNHTAAMMTLGAGLGSAISIDGQMLRGRHGLVGEFGQITLRPGDIRLEQLVTGPGITSSAAAHGHPIESPADIFVEPTPPELRGIRADFDMALVTLLGIIVVACEPEIVVLGGRIATHLRTTVDQYRKELVSSFGYAPCVVSPALGDFSGALGGLVAALHLMYLEMGIHQSALPDIPRGTGEPEEPDVATEI